MRKGCLALLVCVGLTGCAANAPLSEFERERRHLPTVCASRPCEDEDKPFEAAAMAVVDVTVGTAKAVAMTALFAAYLCAKSGYTPSIR